MAIGIGTLVRSNRESCVACTETDFCGIVRRFLIALLRNEQRMIVPMFDPTNNDFRHSSRWTEMGVMAKLLSVCFTPMLFPAFRFREKNHRRIARSPTQPLLLAQLHRSFCSISFPAPTNASQKSIPRRSVKAILNPNSKSSLRLI